MRKKMLLRTKVRPKVNDKIPHVVPLFSICSQSCIYELKNREINPVLKVFYGIKSYICEIM